MTFLATRARNMRVRVASAMRHRTGRATRARRPALLDLSFLLLGTLAGCHHVGPGRTPVRALNTPVARSPSIGQLLPSLMRHAELVALERLDTVTHGTKPPRGRPGRPPNLGPDRSRLGLVLVISTGDRALSLVSGNDTVFRAPIAVESGQRLAYGGRAWTFRTPRGERSVVRKIADPVWTPPDWHYAEAASEHRLRLASLPSGGVAVSARRRLEIHDGVVGIRWPDGTFRGLPTEEHIVFDGTLFIPPLGTRNRRVAGALGHFALDLGQGYMIHGTSDEASIGEASTHGCIRLRNDDMAWLYDNVPVGTRVVIR